MSTAFAESGRPLRSQELRKPMNAPAGAGATRSELATAVDPSRGRCGWVFRVQLVVSAEVRSHVRSVPPPSRKNPATVLNAPELRGSLPPHQHERKTRAPAQSDLIVHLEQPTASPFFPGIRPCRKEEGRPCHHNGRKRRTGLPPPARSRPGRRFFRAAVVPLICATPAPVGHEFGRRGDRPGALPTQQAFQLFGHSASICTESYGQPLSNGCS